jgi:hypothetical protein
VPTTSLPSPIPSAAPSPFPSRDCAEDECAYSVRLLPDADAFAAVSEITMWVDYYAEGATPKGTALYTSDDHLDRTYACLRTGCFTMRFRFAENATGLSFAVESSEGSLVEHLDDAVAGDLQRFYFCAETDACRVDVFPTFSPTISSVPTPSPTALPSGAPSSFPSPSASCGRDDFREILTGQITKHRHRRIS